MRLERLLALTILLLNRRRASAGELSDYFRVSTRTIYRDVAALNEAGIPVISYQGYEGGFCIMDNYKISRQVLTFKDMTAILTALKGVSQAMDNKELDGAMEKIRSLIPNDREEDYRRRSEELAIDISPWSYESETRETFRVLHEGITKLRTVSFDYRNTKGVKSERTVEPMTLVFKALHWYLFAWCRLKGGYRIFKLTRIKGARLGNNSFERRQQSHRTFFEKDPNFAKTVTMRLEFSPKVRTRVDEWFGNTNAEFRPDGSALVTIAWPEDEWVYGFLLGFGGEVKVLSPEHIRRIILERAKKILSVNRNLT